MRAFRARHLSRLHALNAAVVAWVIRYTGGRRLTVNLDGSVVSTEPQVQWVHRGFDPHHRRF